MGVSLPVDLNPGADDGAGADDDPEQIARPRDQQAELPLQEVAVLPQMPHRSHFKYFLKPSVPQVEACAQEKTLGAHKSPPANIPAGVQTPEGEADIQVVGSPWCQISAEQIHVSTAKSRRKH